MQYQYMVYTKSPAALATALPVLRKEIDRIQALKRPTHAQKEKLLLLKEALVSIEQGMWGVEERHDL